MFEPVRFGKYLPPDQIATGGTAGVDQAKAGFSNRPSRATAPESFADADVRVEGRSLATIRSDDAGVDASAWLGAKTIVRLRSVRVVAGQCHDEDRYYLTSVDPGDDPGGEAGWLRRGNSCPSRRSCGRSGSRR